VLKRYQQTDDNEDIQLITSILSEMGADPEERKKIEIEAEALRTLDEHFGRKMRAQAKVNEEQAKTIEEKDKVIEEKDKTIEEKDKTIEEQAKTLEETRKANEEQAKRIAELEHILKNKQE
jgi:methyl-accepting chemotaxis protein